MKQRILAFDPGYDRLGWAVGEIRDRQFFLLNLGLLHSPKASSHLLRLKELHRQMQEVFEQYQPNALAVETLIFARNISTALPVSEVRGMIFTLGMQRNLIVSEYAPSQIKSTVTGNGQADKKAVQKMIYLQFAKDEQAMKLLNQSHLDDTIDAVAILLTDVLVRASQIR